MRVDGDAPARLSVLTEPKDAREQLLADVRHGLTAYRKHLPSKYFYDARGSELFEQITRLPEYYLTRAEVEILGEHADSLLASVSPDAIVELGSGSSRKTRMLLEAMQRCGGRRYVPIDISESALREATADLCDRYPWLEIDACVGDYLTDLHRVRHEGRLLITFLGSTIGNYVPTLRLSLLREVAASLEPHDAFLLGVDLVKDEAAMTAAYDDAAGLSADFNKNILHVVNREAGGDLPVDAFEHVTRFDPVFSCMSQSLRARRRIVANFRALDLAVTFLEGEEIHTEVSCKFTREQVESEFADTGLTVERWLTDAAGQFALVLGRRAAR